MTAIDQPQSTHPRAHTTMIMTGAAVLLCLFASGVALAFAGWETGAIIGLLSGVAGVAAVVIPLVYQVAAVKSETRAQSATLAKIDHQTNGVLAEKIRSEIDAAIPRIAIGVQQAWEEPIPYEPNDGPMGTIETGPVGVVPFRVPTYDEIRGRVGE